MLIDFPQADILAWCRWLWAMPEDQTPVQTSNDCHISEHVVLWVVVVLTSPRTLNCYRWKWEQVLKWSWKLQKMFLRGELWISTLRIIFLIHLAQSSLLCIFTSLSYLLRRELSSAYIFLKCLIIFLRKSEGEIISCSVVSRFSGERNVPVSLWLIGQNQTAFTRWRAQQYHCLTFLSTMDWKWKMHFYSSISLSSQVSGAFAAFKNTSSSSLFKVV